MEKVFTLSEEDYNLLFRLVDDEIDEINDYLVSGYADETVLRIIRDKREKLRKILSKLKRNEEITI